MLGQQVSRQHIGVGIERYLQYAGTFVHSAVQDSSTKLIAAPALNRSGHHDYYLKAYHFQLRGPAFLNSFKWRNEFGSVNQRVIFRIGTVGWYFHRAVLPLQQASVRNRIQATENVSWPHRCFCGYGALNMTSLVQFLVAEYSFSLGRQAKTAVWGTLGAC